MPKIPVYAPQESTQAPQMSRVDPSAGIGLGRSIAGFGGAVSELGQKVEQHDTLVEGSRLAADAATLDAYNKVQWQKYKQDADPKDPDYHNLATKFMAEVVQPNIEALGQNLTTEGAKAQYEVTSARMLAEMTSITKSDQSALTGVAVTQDAVTVRNAYSTGVYADPSTFESTLEKTADERLRLQRAGMPTDKALQWETETNAQLAQSAVRGMAQLNPDKAKSVLDSGKFDKYITGEQRDNLNSFIENTKEAKENDARRARADAEHEATEASRARENEILTSFADPNTGKIKVPTNALANVLLDPKLRPEEKNSLRVIIDSLAQSSAGSGELKNDPGTYIGLFDRIHLPDGDPRKINDENDLNKYLGHGLNFTGLGQLRGEIQGKRTEEGSAEATLKKGALDTAKNMLTGTNPLLNMRDPKGDENYQRFMQEFLTAYDKAQKSGADMNEFMSMDGQLGKMIGKYKRSPAQMMQDMFSEGADLGDVGKAGGAAPASMPHPKTPAEAGQLKPGTHFIDPSGKERVR